MSDQLIRFVRDYFGTNEFIPLHAPVFPGREKEYVADTIESTFVSSVGAYVDRFEQDMAGYTSSPKAVATVNGTAALKADVHGVLGESLSRNSSEIAEYISRSI